MRSTGLWMFFFLSTAANATAPFVVASGIEPYQESGTTNTQHVIGSSTLGFEMAPVPEGKRLVVQHVSVIVESSDADLDMNCSTFGGKADGSFGRVTPSHRLLPGPQFRTSPKHTGRSFGRAASQQITLYIDSGLAPEIGCFFSRELSSSDNTFMQGSVTGYLVDSKPKNRRIGNGLQNHKLGNTPLLNGQRVMRKNGG